MPGPAPKPTALKLLEGNPGKRPINGREPKPTRRAPPCPMWLEPEARREWRRIAPELLRIGLLSVVDGAALSVYCQSFARYQQAERAGETGKVRLYAQLVKSYLVEFGLPPASRARLAVLPPAPSDPMEALLD